MTEQEIDRALVPVWGSLYQVRVLRLLYLAGWRALVLAQPDREACE